MGGFDHPRPRSSPDDMGRRRWTPRPPGTATAAAQACDLLRRPSCRRNSQEGRGGVERLPVLGGEGRRIESGSLRVGDTGVCQCIRGSCCSRVPDCDRAICRVRMDCGVAADGRGVDRFSAVTMADRHIHTLRSHITRAVSTAASVWDSTLSRHAGPCGGGFRFPDGAGGHDAQRVNGACQLLYEWMD